MTTGQLPILWSDERTLLLAFNMNFVLIIIINVQNKTCTTQCTLSFLPVLLNRSNIDKKIMEYDSQNNYKRNDFFLKNLYGNW